MILHAVKKSHSRIFFQATPLRNTVPIVCQVAQAVPQSSFPRTVFTSPFTSTTTITSPATLPKQNDPPKGPPSSRSRRKPQTPRPSLKSMRTESSPALTEDSGLRSTDDIIQNILNENQLEFQRKVPTTPTGARITTIDPSCIRESTTAGAISRWESPESASMFKFDATVGDSTARRAMTSPVMTSPAMTSLAQTHHVTFPAVYQSISGEVMLQDATEVKQFPGLRSPGGTNSAFSSSMLMSSPPVCPLRKRSTCREICLSVCLCVLVCVLFARLLVFVCFCDCPCVRLSVCVCFCQFVCLCLCPFVCLCLFLSICQFVCLCPFVSVCVCLCPFVCVSLCFVCACVCLCPFVCLCLSFSFTARGLHKTFMVCSFPPSPYRR